MDNFYCITCFCFGKILLSNSKSDKALKRSVKRGSLSYSFGRLPLLLIIASLIIAGCFVFSSTTHAFTNPTQSPPNGTPGPLPVTDGGTGASTVAGALSDLGAAAAGANTDITSLAPSTGNPLSIGSAGLKFSDGTTQTTAAQSTQWTSSNGGIYYNGQIGVGTNSYFGYITTNGTQAFDGTGAVDILLNTSGAGWGDIQNDGNGIWSLGYSANSSATTTPLGTPILSWTRGGQVGIGTTAPTSSLEITYNTGSGTEGDLLRLNSVSGNTGNGPGILFTNNSDVLELARIAGLDSGNWGGGLAFYTSPGTGSSPGGTPTERMSINDSGYVGIGINSANSPLQIYTTSNASNASLNVTLSQSGTPTFDFLRAQNSGGSNAPLVDFSLEHSRVNEFEIWGQSGGSSYASRLAINLNSGQVGINNTSPAAELDVTGPSTGSGITLYVDGGGDAVLASGGSLFFDGNYSYATGNYIRPNGGANTQDFFTGGTQRLAISNSGVAISNGSLTLNGENINDVTGGVGLGNVSSGWYSDTSNLSARYPGASGCFYVQNSGGGTTNLTSGACNANGGTVVYGPLTSQGLLVAGSNMAGGTDEFHITNTTGNAYLYAYSTGSTSATIGAWSSGGAVPLVIGGSGLELNGVTRSSWPGSLAARSTFGTTYSGDSATYGGVTANPLELASASITTNSTTNIYISGYSNYVSNWSCGGTADFYLTLDGTQYANVTSLFVGNNNFGGNGATVTDIIPSVAAGTHTVGFWISNGAYSTSCADVTVEPGAVSIMAF